MMKIFCMMCQSQKKKLNTRNNKPEKNVNKNHRKKYERTEERSGDVKSTILPSLNDEVVGVEDDVLAHVDKNLAYRQQQPLEPIPQEKLDEFFEVEIPTSRETEHNITPEESQDPQDEDESAN